MRLWHVDQCLGSGQRGFRLRACSCLVMGLAHASPHLGADGAQLQRGLEPRDTTAHNHHLQPVCKSAVSMVLLLCASSTAALKSHAA